MSLGGLVAYGSSDESDEEVTSDEQNPQQVPKTIENLCELNLQVVDNNEDEVDKPLSFNSLPKPRTFQEDLEESNDTPVPENLQLPSEVEKKEKKPVKFLIPSLSDFKDVDEEMQEKKIRKQPSKSGCSLFSMLPPPGGSLQSAKKLIPHVLTKPQVKTNPLTPSQLKKSLKKPQKTSPLKSSSLNSLKYDSNSEDEEEEKSSIPQKSLDFFSFSSLSKPSEISVPEEAMASLMLPPPPEKEIPRNFPKNPEESQALRTTVMNLPREEILLKNQAEVGPKLPVPEQEYHVDAQGNVAFDEKAIEYLCGKRGVKRKNELIQGTNIIDISGDDMKPDEREWLVKALTEEPVQRPLSMSAGPSSASKKKHQITYLAHQAKAMEIELQNQWAANKMARNQTKSKYGF